MPTLITYFSKYIWFQFDRKQFGKEGNWVTYQKIQNTFTYYHSLKKSNVVTHIV